MKSSLLLFSILAFSLHVRAENSLVRSAGLSPELVVAAEAVEGSTGATIRERGVEELKRLNGVLSRAHAQVISTPPRSETAMFLCFGYTYHAGLGAGRAACYGRGGPHEVVMVHAGPLFHFSFGWLLLSVPVNTDGSIEGSYHGITMAAALGTGLRKVEFVSKNDQPHVTIWGIDYGVSLELAYIYLVLR